MGNTKSNSGQGLLEDGTHLSTAHKVANHAHVGLNHGAVRDLVDGARHRKEVRHPVLSR